MKAFSRVFLTDLSFSNIMLDSDSENPEIRAFLKSKSSSIKILPQKSVKDGEERGRTKQVGQGK